MKCILHHLFVLITACGILCTRFTMGAVKDSTCPRAITSWTFDSHVIPIIESNVSIALEYSSLQFHSVLLLTTENKRYKCNTCRYINEVYSVAASAYKDQYDFKLGLEKDRIAFFRANVEDAPILFDELEIYDIPQLFLLTSSIKSIANEDPNAQILENYEIDMKAVLKYGPSAMFDTIRSRTHVHIVNTKQAVPAIIGVGLLLGMSLLTVVASDAFISGASLPLLTTGGAIEKPLSMLHIWSYLILFTSCTVALLRGTQRDLQFGPLRLLIGVNSSLQDNSTIRHIGTSLGRAVVVYTSDILRRLLAGLSISATEEGGGTTGNCHHHPSHINQFSPIDFAEKTVWALSSVLGLYIVFLAFQIRQAILSHFLIAAGGIILLTTFNELWDAL